MQKAVPVGVAQQLVNVQAVNSNPLIPVIMTIALCLIANIVFFPSRVVKEMILKLYLGKIGCQ